MLQKKVILTSLNIFMKHVIANIEIKDNIGFTPNNNDSLSNNIGVVKYLYET